MSTILRAALGGTVLVGCGLLAGCNPPAGSGSNAVDANASAAAALPGLPASMPLQGGAATAQVAAPAVSRLPSAPRPALRQLADPQAGYAYLDRAASYDDALGDAPPDYAFGYGGVTPWGWQADDGSVEYAEPIDDGYRYYYYEPGADTPYLVRDPRYSYAFDAGALVVVYDHAGRMVPRGGYGPRWDYAGRFLARAEALRAAARADRRQVVAANWAARRAQIAASNASWDAARARDAAWAAYHARAGNAERAHWEGERDARAQSTQRFADFQRRGFQGSMGGADRPAAPQRVGEPFDGDGNRPPFAAERAQAAAATRQADQLANARHLQGAAPQGFAGLRPGGEPRVSLHPFGAAGALRQPERPPAVDRTPDRERGVVVHSRREAEQPMPRAAAERSPAVRGPVVAIHREVAGRSAEDAPRVQVATRPASAAPHVRAAEAPHAAARAEAPRMAMPHAEAPRMQAPHAEAPRPAAAPHPAAPPHAGPPAGGHEHH